MPRAEMQRRKNRVLTKFYSSSKVQDKKRGRKRGHSSGSSLRVYLSLPSHVTMQRHPFPVWKINPPPSVSDALFCRLLRAGPEWTAEHEASDLPRSTATYLFPSTDTTRELLQNGTIKSHFLKIESFLPYKM